MAADHPRAKACRERGAVATATLTSDITPPLARPLYERTSLVLADAARHGPDTEATSVSDAVSVCVPAPRGGATQRLGVYINKVALFTSVPDLPSP